MMYRDVETMGEAQRATTPVVRRPGQHRCEPDHEPYRAEVFESITAVEPEAWDRVVRGGTLFLQRHFLAALEAGSSDAVGYRYVQLYDDERAMGVACFQRTEFLSEPIGPLLSERSPLIGRIVERLGLVKDPFSVSVVVCGSAFSAGEHGFCLRPEADPEKALCSLVKVANQIRAEVSASHEVSGLLFKDFYPSSVPTTDWLLDHDYAVLPSEPNMMLMVDPTWQSFDDYLTSLSSKYRVKAKRAYAKSTRLEVRPLGPTEVEEHANRMRALLSGVLTRADHRLSCPGVDGLTSLRRSLGDELILDGYFLDGELVGFASAIVDGNTLEAHLVGIDYEHNHEHAIYSRILYDYLRHALDRGSARLNYGRTASEIKSTLGAVPVEMTCYVRHRRGTVNRLLPTLARAIRPPSFPLRKPFKKIWYGVHDGLLAGLLAPPSALVA